MSLSADVHPVDVDLCGAPRPLVRVLVAVGRARVVSRPRHGEGKDADLAYHRQATTCKNSRLIDRYELWIQHMPHHVTLPHNPLSLDYLNFVLP